MLRAGRQTWEGSWGWRSLATCLSRWAQVMGQTGAGDMQLACGGRWQGPLGTVPRPPDMRSGHSGSRGLASCPLLPADRGGSRTAVCGPLPKRSHPVLLPSVHEEVVAELSQAQAGIQASSAPTGKGPSDPPRGPAHPGSRGPCACVPASVGSRSGSASRPPPPCPAFPQPGPVQPCCNR